MSWWPGEGNANDIIGGNIGTLQDGVTFAPGEVGQAFQFQGSSYVSVPANPSLDLTKFTIEAWIKPSGTIAAGSEQEILDKSAPFSINYLFSLEAGNLPSIDFFDNSHHFATATTSCPAGAWCHVAGSYDGATLKIYVNGALSGTTSYAGTPPVGQPLRIGQRNDGTFEFNGLIDEVSIYNRALSDADVATIYNAAGSGKCNPSLLSPSSTVLASSSNPLVFGESLILSATVSASGVPTGSVTFQDGTSVIGTATLNSSGQAVLNLPDLTPGLHSITATYSGDANFAASTSTAIVQTVYNAPTCAPPGPGLVSWWPGEGNANDIIGGNSGTLQNGVTFAPGEVGQAFQFQGSSYVSVPANASLDLTKFTIEGWIKPSGTIRAGTEQVVLDKSAPFSINYLLSLAPGNTPYIDFFDNEGHHAASATLSCPAGAWCHVAGSYDGAMLKIYVNGALAASTSYAGTPPVGQPLRIGQRNDGTFEFNGLIDEVSIYNRALSDTEVATIYNANSAGKCNLSVLTGTATAIASSSNPSVLGQSLILTATVSATGTPTGSVAFQDGGVLLGTAALDSSGQATMALSNLTAGSHSFIAGYSGDANFAPSTSAVLIQTVNQRTTSLVVASSLNPSAYGQAVTFTASLSNAFVIYTYQGKPFTNFQGSYQCASGSGECGLSGSFALPTLLPPNLNVPVLNNNGNTGYTFTPLSFSFSDGTNTFTQSNAPCGYACSGPEFQVFDTDSNSIPTVWNMSIGTGGFVPRLQIQSTTQAVDSTCCIWDESLQYESSGALDYAFNGNANELAGQNILGRPGTWTVSGPDPSSDGDAIPTGTIIFRNGSTVIGTASLSSSGQTTLTTSALTAGAHSITAVYSGDVNFAGSTSPAIQQAISQVATSTILASAVNPAAFGQALTFSAVVSSPGGTPTGSVTFSDGSVSIGSAGLDASGRANLTVSNLIPGQHLVSANYTGDTNFTGSTSSAISETVNPGIPTLSVTGGPFTFDGASHSAIGTATGIGSVPVVGSIALTYGANSTLAPINAGVYPVTANFTSSDPNYTNATATGSITINQATPIISVSGGLFAYDGLPHSATATATGVGGANVNGTFTFGYSSTGSTPPILIGSYPTTATFNSSDPNYSNSSGTGSIQIVPQSPLASMSLQTDRAVYVRGQPVQIRGAVTSVDGSGIPNIPVAIQVSLQGSLRTYTPYTDIQGQYHTVFQPASGDGGSFSVTASTTAGGVTQSATANFRIVGFLVTPASLSQDQVMGTESTVPLQLQNVGDASLSAVSYTVTSMPAGILSGTISQPVSTLESANPASVLLVLDAPAGTPPASPVSVQVQVSATDLTSGVVDQETSSFVITLRPAISTPVLIPASLSVGVNPGGSLTRGLRVSNAGFLPMTNAIVSLQDPTTFNWVSLGNASLGDIAAGDSRDFQVTLNPPADLPLGNYAVVFNVSGGSTPLQGTINIAVTPDTMGTAAFVVNDDTGSTVSGATVTLYNATTGANFEGVTDATGQAPLTGVSAGTYSYVVVAPAHDSASGTVNISADSTSPVSVLLSYDVVSLSFLVVPTTIVDQYNVTLNVTYSTTLPKPALQVVPYSLDLSFFPEDAPDGKLPCSLSITNTHPTASVRNLTVDTSQVDVAQLTGQRVHVQFADGTTLFQLGDLAGKATATVGCFATIDGGGVATHDAGNIIVSANYDFSLNGQVLQGTTTTQVPVSYVRPSDLSYQSIPFTYDEKTDPAHPVLRYDGGSFLYTITNNRTALFNFLQPAGPQFNGRNLVAFTDGIGGNSALDVINANQTNVFWRGDFNSAKQSLGSPGDETTYDISTLDPPGQNGLTLAQALNAEIVMNPSQALNLPSYLGFEGQWSDANSPLGYLIPVKVTTVTPDAIIIPRPNQAPSMCDPQDPLCQDPKDDFQPPFPAQDGQILLAIDQKLRLERQAFNAMLGIGARATLTNASAQIQIRDANGNDASSNFFVIVTSDSMGATHGGTISGQATVAWQLIPNAGAGGTLLQGAQYTIQATLSYVSNGMAKMLSTQRLTVTVLPSPKLTVAYSLPFVVMSGKDAKIRVTVQNIGAGTAHNFSIQSMQPRIVESIPANPLDQVLGNPGPLVDFNITGASNTADGTGFQSGNLTISFGDVAPGATVSGYWTLDVSRKGFFIDVSSTYSHQDYQGVTLDPLVLPPTITLVPAIGGNVTGGAGQGIPALTVSVSQGGTVLASDQTDQAGTYYIPDLGAGQYLEQVLDLAGNVLATNNITVLGDQATNFIDFSLPNFDPTLAIVVVQTPTSGTSFTADGVSYTTPHSFTWTIGSQHTLQVPDSTGGANGESLCVGWDDGETSCTRTITVGATGAVLQPQFRSSAEVNRYTRTQLTFDAYDHKWPAENNLGDMVWSELDPSGSGVWQVFEQGPSTNKVKLQITTDQHNHERAAISDDGTIAWFQDGTGSGLGYEIVRRDPNANQSVVEFSSRSRSECDPLTGECFTPEERAAGKTFGIDSTGRTISFFIFYESGYEQFRRFDLTGIGALPGGSAQPANLSGFESPDINSESDIVYADSFVAGVTSTNPNVWMATASDPTNNALIDQGQNPHISDGPNPEIVYVKNSSRVTSNPSQITHWIPPQNGSADPQIDWIAQGLWGDIAGTGPTAEIVYECVVNGISQICTAVPAQVHLSIKSGDPQSGVVGARLPNPLVVMATNQLGVPLSSVGISYAISQQPNGTVSASLNPNSTQTGSDGTAASQFTLGEASGQYQVTASCSTQNCTPTTVVFTANASSGIAVMTNVSSATFTVTGPVTFSGSGTSFAQTGVPPGSYTITYGAVDGYNTPPSQTQTLANGGITFIGTYVPQIAVDLVDPVPDLLSGPAVSTDSSVLASNGRIVQGAAADGVTELVVRIHAGQAGDQYLLTVINDQGQSSASTDEDGAVGSPGDTNFTLNQLTVSAVLTAAGPEAFAIFRAPIDFPRASGQDANAAARSIAIQVQLASNGAIVSVPVAIIRPPVFMIHGIWDNSGLWNTFSPLFSNGSPDPRFSIHLGTYNDLIGASIVNPVPSFSPESLASARANALGFDYNAIKILGQIQSYISAFKDGHNPVQIQTAAVQTDIVAHSMGGNIARDLAHQSSFFSDMVFGKGNVHKVVTIDTPHLGTPLATEILQDANACVRNLLADKGQDFAFDHVSLVGDPYGSFASGAAGDLQVNSPALLKLISSTITPTPTALIAGVMDNTINLKPVDTDVTTTYPFLTNAFYLRKYCGTIHRDPLALSLTSTGWPTVLGGPSDAIVPVSSQLNGLPASVPVFTHYIHSDGTKLLGFGPPAITDDPNDPNKTVPNKVIDLLNTPINSAIFVRLNP